LKDSDAGGREQVYFLAEAGARGGIERCLLKTGGRLKSGAATKSDYAVIHMGLIKHDFSQPTAECDDDRRVIETFGEVVAGSDRTRVIPYGTGLARSNTGGPRTGDAEHRSSGRSPRGRPQRVCGLVSADGHRPVFAKWPWRPGCRFSDAADAQDARPRRPSLAARGLRASNYRRVTTFLSRSEAKESAGQGGCMSARGRTAWRRDVSRSL